MILIYSIAMRLIKNKSGLAAAAVCLVSCSFSSHASGELNFDDNKAGVVVLEGTIGEEINLHGLKTVIELAELDKVDKLILVLDTDGGLVEDARLMAEFIDSKAGKLKIVVCVKKAYSAGIWIMAVADHIYFMPTGRHGAAIAYTLQLDDTPSPVGEKFESTYVSEISAFSESRGQNALVYKAMMRMEDELWSYDMNGVQHLSSAYPNVGSNVKQWDSAESVLALTAADSVRLGIGELCGGDLRSLPIELFGVDTIVDSSLRRRYILESRKLVRAMAAYERSFGLLSKSQRDLFAIYSEYKELKDALSSKEPDIRYKYSGLFRATYLDSVKGYKAALAELKTKIKQISDLDKKIDSELDKIRIYVDEIHFLAGYRRPGVFVPDFGLASSDVSELETAWQFVSDEFARDY